MIGDGKVGNLNQIKAVNNPKLADETTLALRAITEKRASTLTYMVDNAKEDTAFAVKSIEQYGIDNGKDFKKSMTNPHDLNEFADKFTAGLEPQVYEMETVSQNDKEFEVHFHYCPYVNRWLKMGKTPDEMSQLCDLCMGGDAATASVFEDIDFQLGTTIAKGGNFCELHYLKKSNVTAGKKPRIIMRKNE
ncbi:L-2-amino-thiazoline-4-carboxylic acid hydrolase [Loigolactobacillus backii]|uniref:L-2-amino-thiazoline-4-carboxylic acid hydrolase n=1 Tax=Loigolactobacillus backii TaxID=375175 RepID=UPI000C1CB878|nr:L-2-amino-thiazoline-4-carboxylic acid hydrolase [Loigolactobacillus backii]MDA5387635.1 L-2-amino-thiazoline-4-carboxylic acid hydrolase [Loigolactobacillus backii]MDA5390207.1 L-2-amino-thiazoline-4-carboxylic acid hydrolase [Loigolactobacillus backii]PIO82655.1 hypothetical protein BSQ39_03250 [Loigolactobacillus backii]